MVLTKYFVFLRCTYRYMCLYFKDKNLTNGYKVNFHSFIYIYIYIYTHTHTYICVHFHIYIYMCVCVCVCVYAFLMAQQVKNRLQYRRHKRCRLNSWVGKIPGGRHGNPYQYSCLENPWTNEPGGLQFNGLQRVRHD